MAILTGKTGQGYRGLSEPLENIINHLGDEQPLMSMCKAQRGCPWPTRLNEKISQDSSGPRNRRNKHGRIERWSLSSGAFEVFSKYYAPESRNCSSHSTDLQTQRRGMRDQPSLPPTSPGSEVRCQKYIPEGGRVEQKSESAARQSGPRKCCSLSVQDKWGFRALGSRAWSLSQATSQGD